MRNPRATAPRTTRNRAPKGTRAPQGTRTVLAFLTLAAPLAAPLVAAGGAAAVGVPRPTPVERLMESRLTVTYAAAPDAQPRTYTLDCGPAGAKEETDPACEHLVEIGGPERAVPAGQMCSMIYGGPQTAHVTGVWRGRTVDEEYSRTNGCEVSRWQRMVPALPAANGANGLNGANTASDAVNSADASAGGTRTDTTVRS
ncbi:SSI family serine proteinase inhibitor [Streptomyces sp. NPDC088197]|uniref:SSI family serine proteinase inhibitor n=1 Tax=unclassified Streptomyces TaxID=2593676 RepID=UPI0036E3BBC6